MPLTENTYLYAISTDKTLIQFIRICSRSSNKILQVEKTEDDFVNRGVNGTAATDTLVVDDCE